MRISNRDLNGLRPLDNYAKPKYPSSEEIKEHGIDSFRYPPLALQRFGHIILTSALLLPTVGAMGAKDPPPGCPGEPSCIPRSYSVPLAERLLHEDEARLIVTAMFDAEGVTFTEDVGYSAPDLEFTADGFDNSLGIGFEYFSTEDYYTYKDLKDVDPDMASSLYLDNNEKEILETLMETGQDAIKSFKAGSKTSNSREWEYLEEQVQEFIDWLKANGKL